MVAQDMYEDDELTGRRMRKETKQGRFKVALHAQKTGASFRKILPSSAATHLATVLAVATTADLDSCGDTATYSSNGLVI
jgi:hypothetical protein